MTRTIGWISLIGLLLLTVLLTSCGSQSTASEDAAEQPEPTTADEAPDNTADSVADETPEATEVAAVDADLTGDLSFAGSTTLQPLAEQIGELYTQQYPEVGLNIAAGGSVAGIEAIQNGSVDIGMVSRELRDGEQTPGMEVHTIAIDVLAVIVHPDNPVDELTLEELQGIFLGETTNWSEVGGNDEPVVPVIREVTSGTRGAFDDIVLDGEDPTVDANVQVTASEVEAKVAQTENAIGYIGFGHIEPDEIKVLSIDGIAPSQEAALAGRYRLQRPLQLLTGPLSKDLAMTFVELSLSEAGQAVVIEEGWVPAVTDES